MWAPDDVQWYLRTFVDRTAATDPIRSPKPGTLLFPYTYAARTRYWDGGWAYLYVFITALHEHGFSLEKARHSKSYFLSMISVLGEVLHLQNVLSILGLYPYKVLSIYFERPDVVLATAKAWRTDTLQDAVDDIASNPHSRRAIVPAFSYPHLEEALKPQMGKPPYQLFQFLPDNADIPLSSVHEHRSLDIVGGAQLDFTHDYSWLRYACQQVGRPIGDITIIAHNAHEYQGSNLDDATVQLPYEGDIAQWLCYVTDGYVVGQGNAARLMKEPAYAANANRIYRRWRN